MFVFAQLMAPACWVICCARVAEDESMLSFPFGLFVGGVSGIHSS